VKVELAEQRHSCTYNIAIHTT